MSTHLDAEQPALEGLAPRRRRKRAPAERIPAERDPIARVVLDVQTTHLGQTFDYLVDERQSAAAVPGAFVRVRFGGRRVSGVIWERAATSATAASALRYLERVITTDVTVPAALRDDITAIADAYGGTRANILRLAVPPRVAKVEAEQRLAASFRRETAGTADDGPLADRLAARGATLLASYGGAGGGLAAIRDALGRSGFSAFVLDPLPGVGEKSRLLAWMAASALAADRPAVVVLPGTKETEDLLAALVALGLKPFAPTPSGAWAGDVAVLNAALPPADRYRAWMAVAQGQVRCVIGSRAAMYAPVADGGGLFAIMDDTAYQQADGMMPYAQARGVLRLRARLHGGVFVALADARSPISQWEAAGGPGGARDVIETGVGGPAHAISPLATVAKDRTPWIRWLNREELTRLADPSIGARVPHTAVANVRRALDAGPVLFSIPSDGVSQALGCASCLKQARCPRCTGPLGLDPGSHTPRCRWCNAAATDWSCPQCHGTRLRLVRVGAAGTAQELQGLFRGVTMLLSSPSQPHGPIARIEARPLIVIATPGAEPRVLNPDGTMGEYAAVAVLDAWTSLYKPGVDARVDTLNDWMRAVAMCAPRSRGGQALLIGETDPALARSLMLWDSTQLAAQEVAERVETGLPPAITAACVWGRRDAVLGALRRIGALDGDLAACPLPGGGELPGMLGPVPIPQPRTVDARELEGTADRVKAVVRVPAGRRGELATRLRTAVARHVANRETGELRFQIDPKDLI
ncbi:primosomal protein N' [Bifidobacterium pullorum subsp. saeculare]|uniref:Primosomal protein N n=1 Tax=Bifidobacterium pullorum subsp. saeculare TaxID=78257 RepID=A0A939B7H2_9BIFI|nr:primosomal protein N' [Bifidobacterium pullorum]MBM6698837.1 primosomal protein N' [Bifidobacterium pullorum subsp. saeculare]